MAPGPICVCRASVLAKCSSVESQPFGINPEGDIVGAYVDQSGKMHGFLLSRGGQEREDDERDEE